MQRRHRALQISLYVAGKRCAVIGDGPMADERARRLEDAGADVVRGSIEGARIIFCVDPARAEALAAEARAQGALYYAIDRPDLSDFAMPALARRGGLQIAVATDGDAPALAGRFREELERLLDEAGPELDALLDEMSRLRKSAPREELSKLARRLGIEGRLRIG